MAAIIEQNHDENGIIWPIQVAPYQVVIIPVNPTIKEQMNVAEQIYESLNSSGIEVVLDDRDERPGVRFKDADLIGFPIRITAGKKANQGIVEYKLRNSDKFIELKADQVFDKVMDAVKV